MNPQLFLAWASPLAAVLPRGWAETLADLAGGLASRVAGAARRQVACNLAQVLEEVPTEDCVQGVFQTYARYYLAMMRLAHLPMKEAIGELEITGTGPMEKTLARGRGALVLSAHIGHWDVAGMALAAHFGSCMAFVERLQPKALFEFYSRTRLRHGLGPIQAGGSSRLPIEVLRDNKPLAIVSDRAFGSPSLRVPYGKGQLAVPFRGIRLALKMDAGIHVVLGVRTEKGYRVYCGTDLRENLDPSPGGSAREERIASLYAAELRDLVRQHPEQWCMLYPLSQTTKREEASHPMRAEG